MIPDLGGYAGAVLGAYGVTLALLGALVLISALRGAQVRRALGRLERARPAPRGGRSPREARDGPA